MNDLVHFFLFCTLFPVLHIIYVIMLVWILTNYMLWCTWKVSKLTDYNKEGMVYALIAGH